MSRIVFELPESFAYATELQLYLSHINKGGHLDVAQLIGLVSEARYRFLEWLKFPEADAKKVAIVAGDVVTQYRSEGFYGETVRVEMVAADLSKYGFDVVYRMTVVGDGRELARGKIGNVCIGKADRKAMFIPDSIRDRLVSAASA